MEEFFQNQPFWFKAILVVFTGFGSVVATAIAVLSVWDKFTDRKVPEVVASYLQDGRVTRALLRLAYFLSALVLSVLLLFVALQNRGSVGSVAISDGTQDQIEQLMTRPLVQPTHLTEAEQASPFVQGRSFYAADMGRPAWTGKVQTQTQAVTGKTFENCDVYGPAVLVPSASMFFVDRFVGVGSV